MLDKATLTLDQARNLEAGAWTDVLIGMLTGYEIVAGTSSPEQDTPESIAAEHAVSRKGKPYFRIFGNGLVRMPANGKEGARWRPSTDANAAIEAAESQNLLDVLFGQGGRVYWFRDSYVVEFDVEVVTAPTFPLAICRAIAVRHVIMERKAVLNGQ